ncbi:MAG: murein biosynthesis integral membrane protein MurJ [Candidatus Magasanikbacteria bacterium CG10_big_fil_rev_8_21_14_0_10_43_6]|uniref:Probable lipid II flippase MurJ n=1 Tax=Candidatus Magasanikbacteria bacterium CG10_big_fil_rev_8_21_14_0_10_43_6 TaxID=1974650 RepID=A0A2M6W0P1_9BACT|nr:MAG: murein biosynthesis integral membrane protein MurJ [Candidatus Magasanikbacteria bacterium CG10_big_fil_rev_8_21_14_0_10_43_6]
MIKKLLTSQSKTITGAALVLGAASFVSRLIGVARDRIFAQQFGAGEILDVYYAAFRIPDLVYNLLIVGALSAGFIPVFMKAYVKNKEDAWKLTNSLLHIIFIGLLLGATLLWVVMPYVVPLVVPGFSDAAIADTIRLSRIMLLSPLILGVSGVVSGVLQSVKSFFIYSLTPIFYNLGIIIGAMFLVPLFGIVGLAYGVLLGTLLHLLVQLPTLFQHGFRYTPVLSLRDPYVKEIGKLMIPRTLTLATHQLNLLVITIIASTMAVGSLTIFNFANNLQYFPVGIVGISFALAAFPTLSEYFAKGDVDNMIRHLSNTIRQILFFIVPLSIIFLVLRAQIVRVVLGSGKFDWTATITTADTLALFTLSLFAQCLIPLLTRAFYAMHNTWTPLVIAFIGALINIIGSLALKHSFGVAGLALAFSLAAIVQLCMLWFALRHAVSSLQEEGIFKTFQKISVAGMAMFLVMQYIKTPLASLVDMTRFWGILLQGSLAGMLGLTVYAGLSYFLRIEEMLHVIRTFHKKWLRPTHIEPRVTEADEI